MAPLASQIRQQCSILVGMMRCQMQVSFDIEREPSCADISVDWNQWTNHELFWEPAADISLIIGWPRHNLRTANIAGCKQYCATFHSVPRAPGCECWKFSPVRTSVSLDRIYQGGKQVPRIYGLGRGSLRAEAARTQCIGRVGVPLAQVEVVQRQLKLSI